MFARSLVVIGSTLAAAVLVATGVVAAVRLTTPTPAAAAPQPAATATAPAHLPLDQWRDNLKTEGFQRMPQGQITGHGECWAVAPDGDTAVVTCQDGYAATS